jgi:hypothetical protein
MAQATFEITAYGQRMPAWNSPTKLPQILVNRNPFPQPPNPPSQGSGFQCVILDATASDFTSPAAVRSNNWIGLQNQNGSWMSTYGWMYSQIHRQVLTAGDPDSQILLLASYGLDANIPPTADMLEVLLDLGAGPDLQKWETSVDVGSQSGQWVAFPAAYVFAGNRGYAYGEGNEQCSYQGDNPTATIQFAVGH